MRNAADFLKPGKIEHTGIHNSNKDKYNSDDNDTIFDLQRKFM
jgi:hypothetical protein